MSFVTREIEQISGLLGQGKSAREDYDQLYAAQQALVWSLEPESFRSPLNMIAGGPTLPLMDIPADSEGC